jgi:elongation factor G
MPPYPLLSLSLSPRTRADAEKLGRGLQALMLEDPTIRVRTDAASGEAVIGAMGEQQLEIIVSRLAREFEVSATLSRIEVGYLETVTRSADGEAKFVAPLDASPQYAHVKVRVAPGAAGSGYAFSNEAIGEALPDRFIRMIRDSIPSALDAGVLAGYPVTDISVTLLDGSYHDVTSSHDALASATYRAVQDALQKAKPVIVEPIVRLEIVVPAQYSREVIAGLLRARRVHLQMVKAHARSFEIYAEGALANLLGYTADLRAATHGRFSLMMIFHRYEPAQRRDDDLDERDGGPGVREPVKPRPSPRRGSIALPLDNI